MMATYIGPEPGAEPVPPRWRYSKDTCTRMGNQLAGALNAYAESAADAQEDSSSGRNEYGMRSSRFMLKPFTSRGCIAEDEYGFRGAQGEEEGEEVRESQGGGGTGAVWLCRRACAGKGLTGFGFQTVCPRVLALACPFPVFCSNVAASTRAA